jgi:hypothetical protein
VANETGRYIDQAEAADRWLRRMQESINGLKGVKRIGPDEFDIDLTQVDFAEIELRIMAAMKE